MRTMIFSGLLFAAGCDEKTGTDSGAWWDVTDTGSSGEVDGDDDDDDDDGEEYGQVFWGELDAATGEGWIGYFHATSTEGVLCDMEYVLTQIASSSACSSCEVAYDLTIGEGEVYEESGEGCSGSAYASLAGTTLSFGISGEELFIDSGSGFESVEGGYAEKEGDEVFFEVGEWEEGEEDEDDEDEGDEDEDEDEDEDDE